MTGSNDWTPTPHYVISATLLITLIRRRKPAPNVCAPCWTIDGGSATHVFTDWRAINKKRLARIDAAWPASTFTLCCRLPLTMSSGGRRVTEPRRLKLHALGSFLTRGIRRSARLSQAERFDSAGGKKLREGISIQENSESKRMKGVVIEGPRLNPLDSVGPDLMRSIFSALNEDDLACCAVVSKEWRALALDDALWSRHVAHLMEGHRSPYLPPIPSNAPQMAVYKHYLAESEREAGFYWISQDPFWRRQPSMERCFRNNGTVFSSKKDTVFGVHECEWRFTDRKDCILGCFVRINHWPALEVRRRADLGWTMENCWVLYSSTTRKAPTEIREEDIVMNAHARV